MTPLFYPLILLEQITALIIVPLRVGMICKSNNKSNKTAMI